MDDASRDFERMADRTFSVNEEFGTPWSVPSGVSFESTSPERYRLGCHLHGSNETCAYIAQYEELIVIFSIRRSATFDGELARLLTYGEFNDIITDIDAVVSSKLDSSLIP